MPPIRPQGDDAGAAQVDDEAMCGSGASELAGEQVRLARELHDIVAHSVTVMVMQAGGAERILETDPARAVEALARIGECGAQAMEELGRMRRVLGDADLCCRPGLADLDDLLARPGATLEIVGGPGLLDPSVDLTAYRVVESVLAAAPDGAHVAVTLRWADDLLLEVCTDRGALTAAPALGERVAVAGGLLEAAPLPGGGTRVAVVLPRSGSGCARRP
jgi:signal transduction histidine kinase